MKIKGEKYGTASRNQYKISETVYAFRNENPYTFDDNYDVIIGPIADDRLFYVFDFYEDGFLTAEQTISIMNCMNYGEQYAIISDKGINHLKFVRDKELFGAERQHYKDLFLADGKEAINKTKQLINQYGRNK
jgi:hypothetical protein